MLKDTIGAAVQYYRQEAKLTQWTLSRLARLQVGNLSRIENGHTVPTLQTLEVISVVLGIYPSKIIIMAEELDKEL